jgi:peroxiredoxin
VLIFAVNDCAVMEAWARDQNVGGMVSFFADTSMALTKALDVVMDHPGPVEALGGPRAKRFALCAEDGVIKVINVSEGPDDPAGAADFTNSSASGMLECI